MNHWGRTALGGALNLWLRLLAWIAKGADQTTDCKG
jgi:hypothetical protein